MSFIMSFIMLLVITFVTLFVASFVVSFVVSFVASFARMRAGTFASVQFISFAISYVASISINAAITSLLTRAWINAITGPFAAKLSFTAAYTPPSATVRGKAAARPRTVEARSGTCFTRAIRGTAWVAPRAVECSCCVIQVAGVGAGCARVPIAVVRAVG